MGNKQSDSDRATNHFHSQVVKYRRFATARARTQDNTDAVRYSHESRKSTEVRSVFVWLLNSNINRIVDYTFNFWQTSNITKVSHRLHHLTKMEESLSICLSFDYLDNPSSDGLHIWRVYCWGPKEVQCQVWSCLEERFSRKLQAVIPEDTQSVCVEWTLQ